MAQAQTMAIHPTPETKPFWDGVKRNELVLPKCMACGELHHSPQSSCQRCFSADLEWVKCSGYGRVYSYVINHRPVYGFQAPAPDVIAVIELEEGPRVMAYVMGAESGPAKVWVDMPVEIVLDTVKEQLTTFEFRRTQA
ncbi:MAG: Zn-ribbon domain-containing OB-fold protein [Dehalococcoidia bacterium]